MRIERREKYKSLLEARWKLCSVIVFDSLSQTLFLEEREMNESIRWLSCELVKFYVNKSEVTWVSDMTYNVSSIGEIKTARKMMPVVQQCFSLRSMAVLVGRAE